MLQALRNADLHAALHALGEISESAARGQFARQGVRSLSRLVPTDTAELAIDLRFDAPAPIAVTHRVTDLATPDEARRSPLFACGARPRPAGHAMAVPIHAGRRELVSFVFNRACANFSDRECARIEVIRPHLGNLFCLSREMASARAAWGAPPMPCPSGHALTAREREVMDWLSGGKTDRDIAAILGISYRTVHKHLQRIYDKLGVETRTAALARWLCPPQAAYSPLPASVTTRPSAVTARMRLLPVSAMSTMPSGPMATP
jgi:DNA-binding CsgD family transcriptional regulator